MNYEDFLQHLVAVKNYRPSTIRAYGNDLKLIVDRLREIGIKRPRQINQRVIADLVGWMRSNPHGRTRETGLADTTIARRLAALSSYLEYVRATSDPGLQNPLKNWPHRWKKDREPKPIDDMTIDFLLNNIDNLRDKSLFFLLLTTGLRVSELYQLNRDTVTFVEKPAKDGKVQFTVSGEVMGKGGKTRHFFAAGYAVDLLMDYLEQRTDNHPALFVSERQQRLSVRAIQERLSTWCKKLGFSHYNVHRLRHTYATRLANANIDSMILKTLMGHASFNTTQQYFKLTDKTLAQGYFAAMEFVSG